MRAGCFGAWAHVGPSPRRPARGLLRARDILWGVKLRSDPCPLRTTCRAERTLLALRYFPIFSAISADDCPTVAIATRPRAIFQPPPSFLNVWAKRIVALIGWPPMFAM